MARPLRIQFAGAFYHVFCRGNKRQRIFLDDDDRHWFLKVLRESINIYHVHLYCYVLMDNHFHLVLQTSRANLGEFMRRFNVSYTGWFNYHHNTCGHLYQGRYKSLLIDADNYLLEVSRYIHLNPVRKSKCNHLGYRDKLNYVNSYKWSSLPGYITQRHRVDFVDYDFVLGMVGNRYEYRRFVADGLQYDIEDPFKDVQYQMILGNDSFVARIKSQYLEQGSIDEQPGFRKIMTESVNPEAIIKSIVDVSGISVNDIRMRKGNGVVRGIVCELLYRYCDMNQRTIGKYLAIDYSAVSRLRSRLKQRILIDTHAAGLFKEGKAAVERFISNVKI